MSNDLQTSSKNKVDHVNSSPLHEIVQPIFVHIITVLMSYWLLSMLFGSSLTGLNHLFSSLILGGLAGVFVTVQIHKRKSSD